MQSNHATKLKSELKPEKFSRQKPKKNQQFQFDAIIKAPFGAVGIAVRGMQLSVELLSQYSEPKVSTHKTVVMLASQIEAYFADPRNEFNLPLVFKGTPFQRSVWQVIRAIPRGQVLTYSDIANQIGSGPRAVANACGANHLPLVVPCHRVVSKRGLGGFMQGDPNGLEIKKWLLDHEGIKV